MLSAEVSLGAGEARVRYVPSLADLGLIRRTIEDETGFEVGPAPTALSQDAEREAHDREYRTLFNRFLFAAVVAVPVLLTSYPDFVPGLRGLPRETLRTIWFGDAALTLPVLVYSGRRFFVGGWRALRHRSADMNTLVALGTGAAWLYSVVAISVPGVFPAGTAEPFFDVVAVVIALVVLGQAL